VTSGKWLEMGDEMGSTLSYVRKGNTPDELALIICNFTPVVRENYRIGLPCAGEWKVVANSDETRFGGSGISPKEILTSEDQPWNGRKESVALTLPPLSTLVLTPKLK